MKMNRKLLVLLISAGSLWAQAQSSTPAPAAMRPDEVGVLGSGDELTLRDADIEELNAKVFQIGEDGTVGLPMIGRVQAAGLSVGEFEKEVNTKLKVYVKDPQTTVALVQYKSRPVSVLGSVNTPGVYQITGPHSLVQVISMAGGFRQDAGSWLIVTRKDAQETGRRSRPNVDFAAGVTEIRIPVEGLLNGTDPRAAMSILANDTISVGKAALIYVLGDVKKPGGFVLNEHEQLSLLKALSLAEGMQSTAKLSASRILRETNGQLNEIPVDITKVLQGKAGNVMLQPQDVLYVPTSLGKKIAIRTLEAAVQAGVGLAIWR